MIALRCFAAMLLMFVAMTAAATEASQVRFVDPATGALRLNPVTEAQQRAFAKIRAASTPYPEAEVHVLADGAVRIRLGTTLSHVEAMPAAKTGIARKGVK